MKISVEEHMHFATIQTMENDLISGQVSTSSLLVRYLFILTFFLLHRVNYFTYFFLLRFCRFIFSLFLARSHYFLFHFRSFRGYLTDYCHHFLLLKTLYYYFSKRFQNGKTILYRENVILAIYNYVNCVTKT